MHITQFNQILFDELNKLGPVILDRIHGSVDASKLWDGKFERSLLATKKQYNGQHTYHHTVFLSFGSLRISYTSNDKDDVTNLILSYHIPEVNRWFQPLYRNRIERATWAWAKHLDNEAKLRKHIVSKLNSLFDGITEWYADASINIKKFDTANITPEKIPYETSTFYLMGAIGRVRLCAELHKQRCNALGVQSNADCISALSNELLKEMQFELDSSNVFNGTFINESY